MECTEVKYIYEGDKLIRYNNTNFSYNSQGNPTIYNGYQATWLNGLHLTKFNGITFTYDGLGRRTSKGNIKFTYDSDGRLIAQSNGLEFVYDAQGIAGVKYNGSQYFYRKDAQGNIIAILDNRGSVVVKYVYDAWGNHAVLDGYGDDVESGIGVLNPFRYCGYYYDTETELYYLQSRYYDPEVGRFISRDGIEYADPETINGLNLYAYCGNNPVMNVDPLGNWSWKKFAGWVVTGVIAVAAVVAIAVVAAGVVASGGLLGAVLVGAGVGALAGMAGSIAVQGGFSSADPWKVASAGGIGAAIGAISGASSWGMSAVAESIGGQIGFAFGNTAHISSGIKFGKIFNTKNLMSFGSFVGKYLGGLIGGTVANNIANGIFGNNLSSNEIVQQGIQGEIPMWLINFFKWLN